MSAFAADIITSAQYVDDDHDGQIQEIEVEFDEVLTQCDYEAGDWSINTAGNINVSSINGISCSGDLLTINVTADAGVTGADDVVIAYNDQGTAGSLQDSGVISSKNITIVDGAARVVLDAVPNNPHILNVDENSLVDFVNGGVIKMHVSKDYSGTHYSGDVLDKVNEVDSATGENYIIVDFPGGNGALRPNYENPVDGNGDNIYDLQFYFSDVNGIRENSPTYTLNITVNDVNDAPKVTSNGGGNNANINVAENTTAVTTVTVTDEDLPAQTITYSIGGGADNTKFTIDAVTGVLTFNLAPDFEVPTDVGGDGTYDVEVWATDDGVPAEVGVQYVAVTITDVNEEPVITSDGGGDNAVVNVAENTTAVTTVTATDEDLPAQTITYSIGGGADNTKFTIDAVTGVLTFNSAPDFETPASAAGNNTYTVEVWAEDDFGPAMTDSQSITVTVTDVDETVASSGGGGTWMIIQKQNENREKKEEAVNDRQNNEQGDKSEDNDNKDWDGEVCKEFQYKLEADLEISEDWFSDVSESHNAFEALMSLARQGVVQGSSDEHFANLDSEINRAEVAKIVSIARQDVVMLGNTCNDNSDLSDINAEEWYAGYVKNLESKDVFNGYPDGTFKAYNNINVAETYKVLAIAFDLITAEDAENLATENDVQWFIPYKKVIENNIIIPEFMKYEMDDNITRGDFFYLLNELI